LSERHIGIDQGTNNFGIVVVERTIGNYPNIVAANNYTDLNLKKNFKATDVLVALNEKTDLLKWMDSENNGYAVDRVIVHLEQISIRNKNSKQFSIELGKLLQVQALDTERCIVKMSQPHIHRATGPLFHLGEEIIETLHLQPALHLQRRSRAESNPAVQQDPSYSEHSDVEPSHETATAQQSESTEYRRKKKMSSDVFRYIMKATDVQLQQMKLTVEKTVQECWCQIIDSASSVKLDDVGDALLHALDELLCGSTNFKQLVPEAPSVLVNRTVAVAVFPDITYWIVLNCRWNTFVFENFGCFRSDLRYCYYKDQSTAEKIKANFAQCEEVRPALHQFSDNLVYDRVDHIKVIVKQLTGHTDLRLKNEQAGALTDATLKAMKLICDGVIGKNSKLINKPYKELGKMYVRISDIHKDRKFQVVSSTGKHTNAILSCLSWMKQNFRDFVEHRREILDEYEKKKFFDAMLNVAQSKDNSIEMLHLSSTVKSKFRTDDVSMYIQSDDTFKRNIADLVLVAMSKNHQHVKAIAANSRKLSRLEQQQSTAKQEDDVEV